MKNHCLLACCSSAFFSVYFSPPLSQFQLLVVKIGDAWCLTLPASSFNSLCTDSEDDKPPRFTSIHWLTAWLHQFGHLQHNPKIPR